MVKKLISLKEPITLYDRVFGEIKTNKYYFMKKIYEVKNNLNVYFDENSNRENILCKVNNVFVDENINYLNIEVDIDVKNLKILLKAKNKDEYDIIGLYE